MKRTPSSSGFPKAQHRYPSVSTQRRRESEQFCINVRQRLRPCGEERGTSHAVIPDKRKQTQYVKITTFEPREVRGKILNIALGKRPLGRRTHCRRRLAPKVQKRILPKRLKERRDPSPSRTRPSAIGCPSIASCPAEISMAVTSAPARRSSKVKLPSPQPISRTCPMPPFPIPTARRRRASGSTNMGRTNSQKSFDSPACSS